MEDKKEQQSEQGILFVKGPFTQQMDQLCAQPHESERAAQERAALAYKKGHMPNRANSEWQKLTHASISLF